MKYIKGVLMKKALFLVCCIVGYTNGAYANIDIFTEDEINFSNSQGVLSASVFHSNQQFQAFGTYKVSKDLKVVFTIDRLMKGQKLSLLNKQPKLTRRINSSNSKLPKGTKLTLKGENQKEFKDFAEQIKNLESVSTNTSINRNNKMPSTSSGNSSGSGGTSGGGGSIGNVSIGSGGTSGTNLPYTIPTYTTSTINPDGSTTTEVWNSQFCKVPEFLENAIKLSVIDKDGSCVDKMAVRDDTKCEYRYDFANNKAIKQTQFYYVDNESTVQNVGDCVDLVGEEYQAELYKDDTRCSLENTDKDYGGGKGTFFVTQILFRGIDGLIHEATDCIAYGNIKEELVEHIKDDTRREAQRVVNQYYIDPYTQEKIYITKGVRTDAVFSYVENACGDWIMDDLLLQGKRRTEIVFYDSVEYQQFNVTSCDFSTQGGKKSEYVIAYQNLSSTHKEKELHRESKTHNINKYNIVTNYENWRVSCGVFSTCNRSAIDYTQRLDKNINWTTSYVTKDITSYEVYLRPDGTEYKKNLDPSGATFTKIFREVKINRNDASLSDDWLLFWEIHNKHYEDNTTANSNNYQSWLASKYSKGNACQSYSIVYRHHADDSYSCSVALDYVLSNI